MRRATASIPLILANALISIHTLREEDDHNCKRYVDEDFNISVHALREEDDTDVLEEMVASVIFLSTPSARRATLAEARAVYGPPISIHALREEGD